MNPTHPSSTDPANTDPTRTPVDAPGGDPPGVAVEQDLDGGHTAGRDERSTSRPTGRPAVWLAVRGERLRGWRRRALPRMRRVGVDSVSGLPGLLVAALLAAGVAMWPWLRCGAGSAVWGRVGAAISDRVLSRRGWLAAAAALAVAALALLHTLAASLALLAVPGPVVVLLVSRTRFRHSTFARTRARFGAEGWADFWELHRGVSAHAARGVAVTQRPSVAATLPVVPARRQAGVVAVAHQRARRSVLIERLPVTECGTWLGRSTVGPWWGVECYAAFRDTVGLIAPPQTGKTALMTHHVVDHPGAVISTSTKPEIYLWTAALRALCCASGRVELFNPDDLGGLGSTLRWDPVRGCAEFRVAMTRAGLLVGGADTGAGEARWNEWATEVLAGLLMVADLERLTMHDIARWCHAPTDNDHGAGQALTLMGRHRRAIPDGVYDSLNQILATRADKTRDSVFFVLRGAVGFMSDPTAAALCTPRRDEPAFDVERFLADRGTLYLLGAEDQSTATAPLLAALTGHIFATAKHLATHRVGSGRLDPPLLISLDEAALITPVPLPQWVSDAGGRGIHIVWSVQTPSQLRDRWGEAGAQTILNATNSLLIFGGLKNRDDLAEASELCGYRHELVPDPDGDGPGHAKFERVPVCPPDRVRLLPTWHALLIHRTTPATVVRITPAWQRPDIAGRTEVAAAPRPAASAGPACGSAAPAQVDPDRQLEAA